MKDADVGTARDSLAKEAKKVLLRVQPDCIAASGDRQARQKSWIDQLPQTLLTGFR
jgi:hypothetical protein